MGRTGRADGWRQGLIASVANNVGAVCEAIEAKRPAIKKGIWRLEKPVLQVLQRVGCNVNRSHYGRQVR